MFPATPLPTPVEAILPPSPPTQMPPASPKEAVPAVSEAKVEAKRVIEPAVPAVAEIKVESKRTMEPPISPSKTAPEILPRPARLARRLCRKPRQCGSRKREKKQLKNRKNLLLSDRQRSPKHARKKRLSQNLQSVRRLWKNRRL